MVTVTLTARPGGAFASCAAAGHADFAETGRDILCAAVSMLLRTVAAALESTPGIVLSAAAPEKGDFSFWVDSAAARDEEMQLVFAYTVLRSGLRALEQEYPGHICVKERNAQ